jgi:hypothetical protein
MPSRIDASGDRASSRRMSAVNASLRDASPIFRRPRSRFAQESGYTSYGRGTGVGRGRGVGIVRVPFGVGVGVTVPVALGVAVGVAGGVAVAVAVAVAVTVGVAVDVAVGVGVGVGELAETLTTPVIPKKQCAKQK